MHRGRDSGGGLVMGPAVGIHVFCVFGQSAAAGFAPVDDRILQEWCGGRGVGEFGAERPVDAERCPPGDQRSAGHVPERRGAAVAQHDLVVVGNAEEFGQPRANRPDDLLDGGLAVRCAQNRGGAGVQRLHLFGTDLARSRTEASVLGQHGWGNRDGGHMNQPSPVNGLRHVLTVCWTYAVLRDGGSKDDTPGMFTRAGTWRPDHA